MIKRILLITVLLLGATAMAADDKYTLKRHSYYIQAFGADVKFYINGIRVYSLMEDITEKIDNPFQISGGISALFKNGSNHIAFEFKKLEDSYIDERLIGQYELSDVRGLMYVGRYLYGGADTYIANFKIALDKTGKPQVHIWNILDKDSDTTPLPNNDEFVAEQYQKLARDMKMTQLPNGYTRVEATVSTEVSVDPVWASATPYNDSHEHRMLLEEAYIDYWRILNGGLLDKLTGQSLESFYDAFVTDMARYESDKSTVFSMINPKNTVRGLTLRAMLPFENFTVEKNAEGRLLRLVMMHEGEEISPITYARNGKLTFSLMPYFSIVKGKVILTKG